MTEEARGLPALDGGGLEFKDPPAIVWVRVRDAAQLLWRDNPKLHDIGGVVQSIARHGLQALPKFDRALPSALGATGAVKAGNGRIEALEAMERDGRYDLPRGLARERESGAWALPVLVGTDAENRAAAEAYAVDDNNLTVTGGDFTAYDIARLWGGGYSDLLQRLAGENELPVSVSGDDLDTLLTTADLGDGQDWYSKKVEAPIYEPREEKPDVDSLFDTTRMNELLSDIDAADLPETEKEFLRQAAQRHTVFNYHRIADYYAHSDEEMQALMEDSGLVIVDFDRAVELGFVRMSMEMAKQYFEDYGSDDEK